jgi:hypothetical protein
MRRAFQRFGMNNLGFFRDGSHEIPLTKIVGPFDADRFAWGSADLQSPLAILHGTADYARPENAGERNTGAVRRLKLRRENFAAIIDRGRFEQKCSAGSVTIVPSSRSGPPA